MRILQKISIFASDIQTKIRSETPVFKSKSGIIVQLIIQEIVAYLGYHFIDGGLSYWHAYSELEVDAVLGNALAAIEIKSCSEVQTRHLNGLKAFKEEHPDCRCIVVSMDERPRILQGFEILPAKDFLHMLWYDEIVDLSLLL